ncbi:hypothetical protein V2L05_03515 [Pseudomonas alliivorans]|nr:hypothetical protein [Pseudomonas alliivorans]
MELGQIKIASRNPEQKIWMVRADGGKYFEHFRAGSIVSIKHLDLFYDYTSQGADVPSEEVIQEAILRQANFRSSNPKDKVRKLNAKGRRYFNQILHFLHDIKEGDLVVTLSDSRIAIGVCTSSTAFFSSDEISFMSEGEVGESFGLSHTLRKKVRWGPVIDRRVAEGLLRAPFRSQQTITRLDDHWREIYSLIYPFFTDGESLYFSNFIGTKLEIGGKIVSRLFSNLADVEQIFNQLLESRLTAEFVERVFDDDLDADDQYSLTAKAFFASPGGVASKIPLPPGVNKELALKGMAILLLIATGFVSVEATAAELPEDSSRSVYSASGMIEERSLQPSTTKNVDRLLGQLINENKAQIKNIKKRQQVKKVKQKLRLTIPDYDTTVLEAKGSIRVTTVVENEK